MLNSRKDQPSVIAKTMTDIQVVFMHDNVLEQNAIATVANLAKFALKNDRLAV